MEQDLRRRLIAVGETFGKTVRYTADEIVQFALATHDHNPLHHDAECAERARFGRIIASGQHTSAIMMGLVATHFSRSDDGIPREMLCLNFNFSFKLPVFAEQDLKLQWKVSSAEWNQKLGGMLGHVDGAATVGDGKPSVIGRGTVLVKVRS